MSIIQKSAILLITLLIGILLILSPTWFSNRAFNEEQEYDEIQPRPSANTQCATSQCSNSSLIPHGNASRTPPFTLVTAASSNHLCALESFIYSIRELKLHVNRWEYPRIVVYSLGMNETHQAVLDNLVKYGLIDEFVVFDYEKYPAFWNIELRRGQYAWKPGIINEVRLKYGGYVVWMDSGDMASPEFLRWIPSYLEKYGFWSTRSKAFIGRYTHEGMFEYFGEKIDDYAENLNCNAATLGFNTDNPDIVENLMIPWYECALMERCIAPRGSSLKNHRQDQSVITYLAYKNGFACVEDSEYYGVKIHQDVDCVARLTKYKQLDLLLHPSSLDLSLDDQHMHPH